MPGAPEQHRTPTFLRPIYPTPSLTTCSDQRLAEQYAGREHPKPRFYPRFAHTLGSITRKIWRRTVGFCVSPLPTWCVTWFFLRVLGSFLYKKTLIRFTAKGTGPLSPSRSRRHEVKPVIRNLQNVRIPTSGLSPRPNPRSTSTGRRGRRDLMHDETPTDANEDDAMQDWNERTNSLFEWIGMVNIGAQRHVLLSCFLWGVRSPETHVVALDCKPTIGWTHMWLFTLR